MSLAVPRSSHLINVKSHSGSLQVCGRFWKSLELVLCGSDILSFGCCRPSNRKQGSLLRQEAITKNRVGGVVLIILPHPAYYFQFPVWTHAASVKTLSFFWLLKQAYGPLQQHSVTITAPTTTNHMGNSPKPVEFHNSRCQNRNINPVIKKTC